MRIDTEKQKATTRQEMTKKGFVYLAYAKDTDGKDMDYPHFIGAIISDEYSLDRGAKNYLTYVMRVTNIEIIKTIPCDNVETAKAELRERFKESTNGKWFRLGHSDYYWLTQCSKYEQGKFYNASECY